MPTWRSSRQRMLACAKPVIINDAIDTTMRCVLNVFLRNFQQLFQKLLELLTYFWNLWENVRI